MPSLKIWVEVSNYGEGIFSKWGKPSNHLNSLSFPVGGLNRSVRPTIGMMVVNVDVSSAAFYKSGPLIKLCLEYMGRSPEVDPMNFLSANRIEPRARRDLLRFIRGLSVRTTGNGQSRIRSIKDISEKGADSLFFNLEGTLVSLAVSALTESFLTPMH